MLGAAAFVFVAWFYVTQKETRDLHVTYERGSEEAATPQEEDLANAVQNWQELLEKQELGIPDTPTNNSEPPSDFAERISSKLAEVAREKRAAKPISYFPASDFTVLSSATTAGIHTYVNNLGSILIDAGSPATHELDVITEAFSKGDLKKLAELYAHRDAYQTFAHEMATLPVPAPLFVMHQNMANSFWRLGDALEDIASLETDPVGGMTGIATYMVEAERSVEPLKELVAAIKSRNLSFNETEAGAMFNKYLGI